MSKNDARICTLGLPWNKGCAYLHNFEKNFQVPWNTLKSLKVKCIKTQNIFHQILKKQNSLAKLYSRGETYNYRPFI